MPADQGAALSFSEVRRLPWALLAAVLGAATGTAAALLARRRLRNDPPLAQEPHELRAVVDLPRREQSR